MQTILITGGSGFLGRNLAAVLKKEYKVVLGGRNNSINNYAAKVTGCEVTPLDVSRIDSVRDTIDRYKPAIIIHAAATKYVDLSEINPHECIDVNIVGSQNIARTAVDKGIKTVIGISTDKAALPCSGMYSMSKAIMERLFIRLDGQSDTRFCCLRMGNLCWSTGSVFPIWKKMLEKEGHIQTTGYDMRRFMFSVTKAVSMIVDVLNNTAHLHGKILAKKMKAVQIGTLLSQFIALYGGSYEKIAARIGEKDNEHMIGEAELKYTSSITINNHDYYLIDFSNETCRELAVPVSTLTVDPLSEEEIEDLLKPAHIGDLSSF